MVRIGIVSIGFMGMIHYLAARKLNCARVEAICSSDEKKLAGDWRSIQGNFGPRGEMMDLAGVKKYRRLDDMLADPDIDLIDICNPTHLHPETAIKALQAGIRRRQGPAVGHFDLQPHEVEPGDGFGDRVLDLQAGVHLEEEERTIGRHDELDRSRADIADRTSCEHRCLAHPRAQLGGDER